MVEPLRRKLDLERQIEQGLFETEFQLIEQGRVCCARLKEEIFVLEAVLNELELKKRVDQKKEAFYQACAHFSKLLMSCC